MIELDEGELRFVFAAGSVASKYDDWPFYRNQFKDGCSKDNKAVDMVASIGGLSWLIEVKDYRVHRRSKVIDLAEEVAQKVRDTLAGLVAAQHQSCIQDEKKMARELLRNKAMRVVCHLEQPHKPSRLRPQTIEPDKLQLKLKSMVRAIDPHPMVVDSTSRVNMVPWKVETGSELCKSKA